MPVVRSVVALLLVFSPCTLFAAGAKMLSAQPRITAVTVYPDRALTVRSAAVSLTPGSWTVAFDSLPVQLLDDSVRMEGKGSAAVTITGIEVRRRFLEQAGGKKVREIDDEIRALELRSGGLDARRAGLQSQKAFIESIRVAWGDRISKELAVGRPTSAELQEASGFVGNGIVKVEEQMREIDAEKRQIKDKVDALRRQRDEASSGQRREVKAVEIGLEVARGGELTLELSSVVPQASWEPVYDVRLARDGKQAELTTRALIRQQTGEEWNDVSLTLSTARPAAGGAPPELYPWRISFYRPPTRMPAMVAAPAQYRAKKSARMMEAADSEESLAVAREEAPAAAFQTAQVSGEQTSVSFRIPRPLDIPSDGSQHGTVVSVETLPVDLEFQAVPKFSPAVFLFSRMVNKAAYPLLPGRVNTFIGATFTGSSHLKKVAVGEGFDLFFGSDDQMTVKREELKQRKEAGLFGGNRMTYRYRVEAANFRTDAQVVTLKDQLPLAGDAEIKVTLDEPSVKPDEVKADGTLVWKLPLRAGEKREISYGIVVEYPKDREITGL